MFDKVLIANRGAIACRIIRTLRSLGVRSVAIYSDADRHSLHVSQADEAVRIGPPPATQSYLSIETVIEAAQETGAQAIHPGYGFLSERPEFAEACEKAGIRFLGPTGEQMRAFSLKHTARQMASDLGLPMLPGTGLLHSLEEAKEAAERIGYPVMLKSTAGGGGIGIRLCRNMDDLILAFDAVQRLGANNFGDSSAFLERFIEEARHVEVQIFGDGAGQVIALGERDCSTQRRNQKVIEETPAPGLSQDARERLCDAAVRIAKAVNYRSAGTVEFVYDNKTGEFFFLEVNTRLQVEHGVTEAVTGIDLVEWMVREGSGDLPDLGQISIIPAGHSFEARLYAEDPGRDFQPSSGRLTDVSFPVDARVETWVEPGTDVTPYYDPMIAKVIVHGRDRSEALVKLRDALSGTQLAGIETNLDYLRRVCASNAFAEGAVTTSFLAGFPYTRHALEVTHGGAQTTVQDYPGRVGYWNVGVPPSGPMDSLAFRLANKLVGNHDSAAALEITISGPELKFGAATTIALTGADMGATLDGVTVPQWEPVTARSGSVLKMKAATGPGMRAYLAVAGGFDVSAYLGSRSTFMLGKFGGHAGRALRSGDVVHYGEEFPSPTPSPRGGVGEGTFPQYTKSWTIGVLYGPHGAPDFFRDEDIAMFFETEWRVHHQSDRTGVRLIGPKPKWARKDGGEAGLHPSNIHDNAYAIGAIDFTGDMPIILGPDGPSLGGFVCPAVIVHAELWKMGQLRAGDTVRFHAVTHDEADAMATAMERSIVGFPPQPSLKGGRRADEQTYTASLEPLSSGEGLGRGASSDQGRPTEEAIVLTSPAYGENPAMVIRADGDRYILIEFGDNVLDLALRLRVHALETKLRAMIDATASSSQNADPTLLPPFREGWGGSQREHLPGIIDMTAGVRSLQIHFDPEKVSRERLIEIVVETEATIPEDLDITVPSRIVYLPLSWDDPQTRLAAEKYMQSVRPDAPWCPDNIEFIRRINGLDSIDDVKKIIFDASYLVLGLGDVYLGAPVATPVDPRHRLVTTKYNPARTWTPENAVGIGGAYMCVYGMEGPGGYQLFGRTIQMWNTFKSTDAFEPGTPWLLRLFDQIRFYPVSADELMEIRDAFPHGKVAIRIEETEFRYRDYQAFLESIKGDAAVCRARQQAAFAAERARWEAAGQSATVDPPADLGGDSLLGNVIPDGCEAVTAPLMCSVWKVLVTPGQRVEVGDELLVLEAMKTEIMVTATHAGTIEDIRAKQEALVEPGQPLVIIRT